MTNTHTHTHTHTHTQEVEVNASWLGCLCGFPTREDRLESTNTKGSRVLHDEGRPEKPKDSKPPWIREELLSLQIDSEFRFECPESQKRELFTNQHAPGIL